MARRYRFRSFLAGLFLPLVALAGTAYFVWHAHLGLDVKARAEEDAAAVRARLERVRSDREVLERRVSLLRDAALDRDMLDERARVILNLGQGSDLVVLRAPTERLQAQR